MMNFRRERVELRIMQMKVDGLEDVMIIDKRERERQTRNDDPESGPGHLTASAVDCLQ